MIKQTRNAMHMLFAAYMSVYRQAMSKGASIRCAGTNTLKLLLILSSVGCAYASTSIQTPFEEKALNIITPNITEDTLSNGSAVDVGGNLGSQMGFMIQENADDNALSESVNDYNGNYQSAVNLLNKADFHNITNYGVSESISVSSVNVHGGMARFELGINGQNFSVSGETNVSAGLLHIDTNNNTATFGNTVTYSGMGTGHLSGTINLSSGGLIVKDQAALDLGTTTINGNVTVLSKGVTGAGGFSDLERQYGVWGTSAGNFISMTDVNGGIQVGHKSATINGKLNIDNGRVVVGDFDDYSSDPVKKERPSLTVKDNVTVENGGEIKVLGKKVYPAELTLEKDLVVSGNGSLVTVGSKSDDSGAKLTVAGNTVVNEGGSIDIGHNGEAYFNGDTSVNGSGSISTNGNGKIFFKGEQVNIQEWMLTDRTTKVSLEGKSDVKNSNLDVQNISVTNEANIVGTTLLAETTELSGTMKLDPSTLTTSSLVFSNNGKLAVLTGSATYVGNRSAFESTGTVAEGSALLALASGISIGNTNAVYVDGSKNNDNVGDITNNTFTLKSGSTLALYGNAFSNGAAVTFTDGNGTFTVEEGSKIVLKGRQTSGKNIVVTGANGINTPSDWKSYLSSGNILYQINDVTADNGQYVVDLGISSSGVAAVSGGISSALSRAIISQANGSGTDSSKNNGLGLISQMIENIGTGSEEEVSRFRDEANSVTGFIFGGVPLLNVLVAQVAHDNVEQHNGFTTTGANHAAVQGTNATVWAMPFYKHSKSDSFKIEGSTYGLKAKIYGLSMGTDFEVADGLRLGFDGIVGHAKTDSRGSLDPSEDDASFWGLGTYGSYNYENLKVMADIGYTEMNTDTDLFTSYGTLSSNNTKSYTFTTGVNAKYSFALAYVDVAPHAGIRFNHANIDKYKVKRQGEVLMTGDSISQNYFQFPVGVEVSKQLVCGEWNLKPMFDLTATINTGDKKLDAKATLTGFDSNYGNVSTNAEVLDTVSVRGSLGIEASYGALGLGAGYSYTGSENVKDHVFAAGVNYTF